MGNCSQKSDQVSVACGLVPPCTQTSICRTSTDEGDQMKESWYILRFRGRLCPRCGRWHS